MAQTGNPIPIDPLRERPWYETRLALKGSLGSAGKTHKVRLEEVAEKAHYRLVTCYEYLGSNPPIDDEAMWRFIKLMGSALDEILADRISVEAAQRAASLAASPIPSGGGS